MPNPDVVVLRVEDLGEKAALVAPDALAEMVVDSWRAVAPKRLQGLVP